MPNRQVEDEPSPFNSYAEGGNQSLAAKDVRRLLGKILITTSEFDAFCLDYFPAVKKNISPGMDQVAMFNKLIEFHLDNLSVILGALHDAYPKRFETHYSLQTLPALPSIATHDAPVNLAAVAHLPLQPPLPPTVATPGAQHWLWQKVLTRRNMVYFGAACVVTLGISAVSSNRGLARVGTVLWQANARGLACVALNSACHGSVANRSPEGDGCFALAEEAVFKECHPHIPETDLLRHSCDSGIAYACVRRAKLVGGEDHEAGFRDFQRACDLAEKSELRVDEPQTSAIAEGCHKFGFKSLQGDDFYNGFKYLYKACELGRDVACKETMRHINKACKDPI